MDDNRRNKPYSNAIATETRVHHATSILAVVCWMIANRHRVLEQVPGLKYMLCRPGLEVAGDLL